ncbi:MAG: hypothetical protein WCS65_07135 [Verrucomicrobiae bacterium]
MKLKITSLIAIGLGAFTSFAGAQTVIDITGSTAGRTAVHNNILLVLKGTTYAYVGSATAGSAVSAIYKGRIGDAVTGPLVTIRTYWLGSVNGVRDVGDQIQQTKLLSTDEGIVPTTGGGNYINPDTGKYASASVATAPEIGFSDVFGASTGYSTPVETSVAVIPFKFYKNANASGNLTNMTANLVRRIYNGSGDVPLALFTGDAADEGSLVYGIGRNSDSGTRITLLAESGFGVFNSVTQYSPTVVGGVITALAYTGNTGVSGSAVKNAILATNATGSVVGYVGASDWPTAPTQELTWNGVPYSQANLFNGKYTFWGYLHMNSIALTGDAATFFTALSDSIKATATSGLEAITSMRVERAGDGDTVYPLY